MSCYRVLHTGHAKQFQFWRSGAKYPAFIGGIGSGKTRAGGVKILQMPARSRGMVVAPTYAMLRDATLASFLEFARPLVADFNRSTLTMTLVNGTEILWRSADKPNRLRGPNLGWAWIDEAGYLRNGPSTWEVLQGRLRHPLGPGQMWVTTTPKGRNWLWKRWANARTSDYHLVQCATGDNTFLPQGFASALASEYTSEFARQELLGEFVDFSGGIFRREWFDRVVDPAQVPEGLKWFRYWDLAVSQSAQADYTASLKAALHRETGDLYLAGGIHGKWTWPEARGIITRTALNEPDVEVGVESVGFQLAAFQDLLTLDELVTRTFRPIPVDRDKVSRAQPWAARAEQRRVVLVRGEWIEPFLDEACALPEGDHDDWPDAASGAVAMIPPAPSGSVHRGRGKRIGHRVRAW